MPSEPVPAKIEIQEPEEPGLREYWQIIVEGRWIIAVSFLVVVLSTALFTFTAHPVYQASARILVDTSKLASNDIASILSPLISGTRNDIQNRIEVMSSPPVLQATIEKLQSDPKFIAALQSSEENSFWYRFRQTLLPAQAKATATASTDDPPSVMTADQLASSLQIKQVPNTDLIEVQADGGSPAEAQLKADALIAAYTEQDRKFAQATLSSVKDFLAQQLPIVEARVQQSQQALVDFEKSAGLELNPDDVGKKLLELETLLAQAKVDLEDQQRQLDAINVMLDQVTTDFLNKETGPDQANIIDEVQLKLDQMRKLQQDITDLETKRSDYLNHGNYIMVKEMEDQIIAKHQAVEQAARQQLNGFDLLPKYEDLIQKQLDTTLEIQALQDRVDVIQQAKDTEAKHVTDNALQFLQVQENLTVDKNVYELLREEYEKARLAEAGQVGGVQVVNLAELPQSPIKPNKRLNLILAAMVGLILGTGITFLRSYLDNTIKTMKDVEKVGLTGLGTVLMIKAASPQNGDTAEPLKRSLLTNFDVRSPEFDAYVTVDSAIQFIDPDHLPKVLLVTSALPGEGKSTTAINLALVAARSGKKTLLVDADLRRPGITPLFALREQPGLTDLALQKDLQLSEVVHDPMVSPEWRVLEPGTLRRLLVDRDQGHVSPEDWQRALEMEKSEGGQRSLQEILVRQGFITRKTLEGALAAHFKGTENFHVLPTGELPPNAAAFLSSDRVHQALAATAEAYDLVILDSPPLVAAADTAIVSSYVDGVVLVVEAARTTREQVGEAAEQLGRAGGRVIGVVLNKATPELRRHYGNYYKYGYGYGDGQHGKERSTRANK